MQRRSAIGLFHLQRLIEKQTQVREDRGVANDQRSSGTAGGGVNGRGWVGISQRDHGNMGRGLIAFELRDRITDALMVRFQICDHEQRLLLFGGVNELSWIGKRMDAVSKVLQPVHQLSAREQFLIEEKRERLRHAKSLAEARENCKSTVDATGEARAKGRA